MSDPLRIFMQERVWGLTLYVYLCAGVPVGIKFPGHRRLVQGPLFEEPIPVTIHPPRFDNVLTLAG